MLRCNANKSNSGAWDISFSRIFVVSVFHDRFSLLLDGVFYAETMLCDLAWRPHVCS